MDNNQKNTAQENPTSEVVETKTKKRIHFQNPFKVESVEVPVKAKKEKPAKEPKLEKPKGNGFAKGFAAGLAAGSALTAGASIFGGRLRKGSADDISEDADLDSEDEFDEAEDSEDSTEETSEE